MITAFASATVGYGKTLPRAIIQGAHVSAYAVLFALVYGINGLFAAPICLAWWFLLRSGKQAKIELKKMDTINPPHPSYREVLKAHYYTGWLTLLALWVFNYDSKLGKLLGWNTGNYWDCRRPTEFATGLTLDLILLGVLSAGWIK